MRISSGFSLIVVLLAATLAPPATAGIYTEHEAVLPNPVTFQPIKQTIRSWREGRRYKRENPLRNETVVVDLDKREVIGINAAQRTYWKLPADKYQQLAMLSLVVMGVTATPDGKLVVPDPMFVPREETAVIEGRKARRVDIGGQLPQGVSTSIWLSDEVKLPIDDLVEQLRISLGDPKGPEFESLFRQWKQLKGYPVQTVTVIKTPQAEVVTSETLLRYEERKIPLAEFEVPKGFALVSDPITDFERAAVNMRGPAGIGAPLKPASGSGQPLVPAQKSGTPK
jgi:hypothetical protein